MRRARTRRGTRRRSPEAEGRSDAARSSGSDIPSPPPSRSARAARACARSRARVTVTVRLKGSACSSQTRSRSASALTTAPSAASSSSRTPSSLRVRETGRPARLTRASGPVEHEVAVADDRRRRRGPPGQRVDPRHELLEGERLGQVVVGARGSTRGRGRRRAWRPSTSGCGHCAARSDQGRTDGVAVHLRQVAVEHDDVVVVEHRLFDAARHRRRRRRPRIPGRAGPRRCRRPGRPGPPRRAPSWSHPAPPRVTAMSHGRPSRRGHRGWRCSHTVLRASPIGVTPV